MLPAIHQALESGVLHDNVAAVLGKGGIVQQASLGLGGVAEEGGVGGELSLGQGALVLLV